MPLPDPGSTSTGRFAVSAEDTAAALGSGDLPVLATPRLLAWCEAVCCASIASALPDATSTVGTRVSLEHLRPTPVGKALEVTAVLAHTDGRLLRFEVMARDEAGKVVAQGEVNRVAVQRDRYLDRIG
ncbi:MAG TPA: hotdog domain-containing protein [Nocardioidaceae bacterium]|nr:hotdog domain-containing protein [Nocardioidaceae bacterium]